MITQHIKGQGQYRMYTIKFSIAGLMFTVVDFKDGVLGLAWIADPNREDSGICSKPYTFKNSGTKYFNSGIISSINYGVRACVRVVEILYCNC